MNLLEQIRTKLADQRAARDGVVNDISTIISAVEADEARSDLNADETTRMQELRAKLPTLDADIAALEAREVELADIEARKAEASTRSRAVAPTRVTSEERTYRPDGDHDFIADAFRSLQGDSEAAARVRRAREEALVDYRSTTGNFGSLVVPQYLTDLFAPNLRSGRPFLNAVNNVALPDEGMTITIPRGAGGTSTAAQETQNTEVSNTTYIESDLTVPVRTFAGQQLLSRQAVERGRGIAEIILADLFSEYATKVNVSAIAGDGTAGTHYGVLNTTSVQTAAWTGTTGASLVSSIHKGIGLINEKRFLPADLIVMHPRRWAWLCAQSDSSGRPLVQVDGPGVNAVGNGDAASYGIVGSIAGVPVLSDAGVPTALGVSTDEDRIIITRRADNIFMEDGGAPVGLRFDEAKGSALSVQLVTYGFSAFTAGRYPVATCVLSGTGFKQVLA